MTATTAYTTALAAARAADRDASKALAIALKHVEPLTADLHTLFLTRPAAYAECLRKMAAILDTLPALRADAAAAAAALASLDAQACWTCHGTGRYEGPTNARRRGVPYCFDCGGDGRAKAHRN
jgi:mono/diheme cytochrome c family protein